MYHGKAKIVHRQYKTRKDKYHTTGGFFMSYYAKKPSRKSAESKLRSILRQMKHTGNEDLPQNGDYKKMAEVQWEVV